MIRLKEKREERGMTQPELAELLKEADSRIDTPMVSRYERGVCLPTREQLRILCEALASSVSGLYDLDTINLLGEAKRREKARPANYKLSVRIPKAMYTQEEIGKWLKACGYHGVSDWIFDCLEKLQKRAEKKSARTSAKVADTKEKYDTAIIACATKYVNRSAK